MGTPNQAKRQQFIEAWSRCGGSPARVAGALKVGIDNVYRMRARLASNGVVLQTIAADGRTCNSDYGWQATPTVYPGVTEDAITDGCAFFFGDAHWWGPPSLAHRAMCLLAKQLKPKLIIGNGDLLDAATVSRHDPLGWQRLPTLIEEVDTVKIRLREIEQAAPSAKYLKTVGNHDSRFDRRLATEVGEFEGVPGMRLQDHISWPMSYVVLLNKNVDPLLVMHNFRGGVHATWNNVIHAGCTIVTGHLHSQDRKAHTNFFRTNYGVDHGCLADPDGPQFSYAMNRPRNWRSGCCVMTFDEHGRHLPPEFLEVQRYDGFKRATFRGEAILEEGSSEHVPCSTPSAVAVQLRAQESRDGATTRKAKAARRSTQAKRAASG